MSYKTASTILFIEYYKKGKLNYSSAAAGAEETLKRLKYSNLIGN